LLSTCLVDVGVRDESGQTGLMIAVKRVNLAMVNCLLRHGANVRAKFNYNNLFHDDSEALTPFMFLAFADTGDEFYREVAALEMISLLNQHELALIKHDMEHGIVPRAMSAPESPDDARFKELIKRYHSAETALKFIRRHTGTKHVIQLFLPETLSLSLRDIFSK
jgi:ankyrin repeat protein